MTHHDKHDWNAVRHSVNSDWDNTILPALSAYIEVPNQSPDYDLEWKSNGLMEKAFNIQIEWMKSQNLKGMHYEYIHNNGRTPFLFVDIAASSPTKHTVLMYGHMDKQPPLRPWSDGLDPHKAVIRDNKLYGRGGADDGYALFSAINSVKVLQQHHIPHGHIIVIIEAGEESGSPDLDYYMDEYRNKIGDVDLMVCLDSGSMNYEQVWLTTSLRGVSSGVLKIQTLKEGMHSGVGGGVVPDTFRVARILLDRIEDSATGNVKVSEAYCDIPEHVMKSNEVMKTVDYKSQYAFLPHVHAEAEDSCALALRNCWKPSLTVVGANLPEVKIAGNVIRQETALKLSLRTPPLVDSDKALDAMAKMLLKDPPYGAKVEFEKDVAGSGCATPELKPWLTKALEDGSMMAFNKTFGCMGMGGSIPFIGMLIKTYPNAQFIVTGILGPKSNAHGPDEFLHIPYVKGLTFSMARVLGEHYHHTPKA